MIATTCSLLWVEFHDDTMTVHDNRDRVRDFVRKLRGPEVIGGGGGAGGAGLRWH